VAQRSKALHLSARCITAVPGLNPGCITSGRDWESHRAANWLAWLNNKTKYLLKVLNTYVILYIYIYTSFFNKLFFYQLFLLCHYGVCV
jgi:hypothetical protein